jgi:hypothetical protein
MKTLKLMNSAMMPVEGYYHLKKISFKEFITAVIDNNIESYIGYQQNIDLIKEWSGKDIELNRSLATFEDGNLALIMKLNYRVANPKDKGNKVDENSFEFFIVEYRSEK